MRTEVKLAVVVVLVAVIGVASYFLSRGNEKPIELSSPGPTQVTPKVQELPLGPGGGVMTEKPITRSETPATPIPGQPGSTAGSAQDKSKPVYTIDLKPTDETPTTKPGKVPGHGKSRHGSAADSSGAKVIPNQPAKIDLALETPESDQAMTAGEKTTAKVHIVKPNENLLQIAKQYYGRSSLWTLISKANHDLKPKALKVGMKLTIPPGPTTKAAGEKTKTPESDQAKNADRSKARTYTVKPDDTLYRIARYELGEGTRWKEILDLNKDKLKNDPKNLKSGQTIYIPIK